MEHPGGPLRYLNSFDVKILDFTYEFIEDDDVIEPGEIGFISSLTIENAGLMPSPINSDFYVSVIDSKSVHGGSTHSIPRALEPKSTITIPFRLDYQIKWPDIVHNSFVPF